jgi:hypothetical protein
MSYHCLWVKGLQSLIVFSALPTVIIILFLLITTTIAIIPPASLQTIKPSLFNYKLLFGDRERKILLTRVKLWKREKLKCGKHFYTTPTEGGLVSSPLPLS